MTSYLLKAYGVTAGETFNFGIRGSSAAAIADMANQWGAALTALWTSVTADYATEVEIQTASAVSFDLATGTQINRTDEPLTLAGTGTGNSLPPQCAIVISLRTAVATRAGRGRFYLPAPVVGSTTAAGRISSGMIADVVAGVGAMFSSLDSNGFDPQIYHRPSGATPGSFTPVSSANVGDVFDTQRRRRDKLIESRTDITL